MTTLRNTELHFLDTFRKLLVTGDLDPLYPFLKTLFASKPQFDRLWFTQLYAAYYRVDSAFTAFQRMPTRAHLGAPGLGWNSISGLPVATERRNLRARAKMEEHLSGVHKADSSYWSYWMRSSDNGASWSGVYDAAKALPQNGPWAAFKWTDLARYVLDWSMDATPPSVASGKGPAAGLELLGLGLEELEDVLAHGGIDEPWDRVETALCKWHGVQTGTYHVGKDLKELHDMCQSSAVLADTFRHTYFPLVAA